MALKRVVSGGQSGVDRAALDAAAAVGIAIGGWCPRGRWAEDGPIPAHYPLVETRSENVHVRTQRNVETSSATLVVTRGSPMGGSRLTVDVADSMCRPLLIVDLNEQSEDPVDTIVRWLHAFQPAVLNVAGPRESGAPGIYEQSKTLLKLAFDLARDGDETFVIPLSNPSQPHAAAAD